MMYERSCEFSPNLHISSNYFLAGDMVIDFKSGPKHRF